MKPFKPKFAGQMKIFLHDKNPDFLAYRAEFTKDWLPEGKYTGGRRGEIMRKKRKYHIKLSIVDKAGFLCGESELEFTGKGGQKEISKTVFDFGNALVNEIREKHPDYDLDLTESFAEVAA